MFGWLKTEQKLVSSFLVSDESSSNNLLRVGDAVRMSWFGDGNDYVLSQSLNLGEIVTGFDRTLINNPKTQTPKRGLNKYAWVVDLDQVTVSKYGDVKYVGDTLREVCPSEKINPRRSSTLEEDRPLKKIDPGRSSALR